MLYLFGSMKEKHPEAQKIPEWTSMFVFDSFLTDEEEKIMDARMKGAFSDVIYPLLPEEDPLKSLLYVAYAHPEITDEELISGARKMHIPERQIAKAGMILGRPHLYRTAVLEQEQLCDIIKENDFLVMFLATLSSNRPLLDDLAGFLNTERIWEMIKADDYRILFWNNSDARQAILDHLFNLFSSFDLFNRIAADNYKLLLLASAKDRDLRILNRLFSTPKSQPTQEIVNVLAINQYQLFAVAAINSNTIIFFYLLSLLPTTEIFQMIVADDFQIFRRAAEKGHLDIIRLFMNQVDSEIRRKMFASDNFSAFRSAVRKANFELFELALEAVDEPAQKDSMLQHGLQEGFSETFVVGNYFRMMERLVRTAPQHINLLRIDSLPWWNSNNESLQFLHYLIGLLSNQLPEFLATRKETKQLVNLQIPLPDTDCLYQVKYNEYPERVLTISYGGGLVPVNHELNVNTLNRTFSINNSLVNPISYESRETLPLCFMQSSIPLYAYDYRQSSLQAVSNLHVFNRDIIIPLMTGHPVTSHLELANRELQEECQPLTGGIPLKVGNHPIYKTKNKPNFRWLSELYDKFWQYNKDKITYQYAITPSRCHVRAHFVSTLLRFYGVDSVKVLKFWDKKSCSVYEDEEDWGFHCAVMIIDSNNDKWIWDPWVGANSKLLSLSQWIDDKNAPVPSEVWVHNRGVLTYSILDRSTGLIPNLAFDCTLGTKFRRFFQALCASAIPNPPEITPGLGKHPSRFFHSSQRSTASSSSNDERQIVLYRGCT